MKKKEFFTVIRLHKDDILSEFSIERIETSEEWKKIVELTELEMQAISETLYISLMESCYWECLRAVVEDFLAEKEKKRRRRK